MQHEEPNALRELDWDKTYLFYGVAGNFFRLNDMVFEAVEDPDDGYRSALDTIRVANSDNLIFLKLPLAEVKICEASATQTFDGYEIFDVETNHIWLTVGTQDANDYYPMFTFNYSPDTTLDMKTWALKRFIKHMERSE